MKFVQLSLVALIALTAVAPYLRAQSTTSARSPHALAAQNSALEFIPNRGQLADQYGKPMPEVLYYLDAPGVKTCFTSNSIQTVFSSHSYLPDPRQVLIADSNVDTLRMHRIDLVFEGANPSPRIEAFDTASDYTNYYLQHCSNGILRVPAFRTLLYHDLYPGVDLRIYIDPTNGRGFKYDFIVAPHADASSIRLRYVGADSVHVGEEALTAYGPLGYLSELKPVCFQNERRIDAKYEERRSAITIALGRYEASQRVIIDPPRIWGTYVGGSGQDFGQGMCLDPNENLIVGGTTTSSTGLASPGAYQTTFGGGVVPYDALLLKFDVQGNRKWATYYGGSGDDNGLAVAAASDGTIVLVGNAQSTGVFASPGAVQTVLNRGYSTGTGDGFVARFDSTGARLWGTLYGADDAETFWSVAIDSSSNIICAGQSRSDSVLLTTSGVLQSTKAAPWTGLVVKLSSSGALLWSSYFGGNGGHDVEGVAIGEDSLIYIYAGVALSTDAATPGAWQTTPSEAVLAKISPNGDSLLWSTYCLGTCTVSIYGAHMGSPIAVGKGGVCVANPVVCSTGVASANADQTVYGGGHDWGLQKFSFTGQRLWGTYMGGSGDDEDYCVTVDKYDNVYVGGNARSTGLATPGEYQTSLSGGMSPFLAKYDSSGHKRWATYYGSGGQVTGLGIGRYGHVYGAGYAGGTGFASTGAYQISSNGGFDLFLFKFCDTIPLPHTTASRVSLCPGYSHALIADSGFTGYQWSKDGTQISGATNRSYSTPTTLTPGSYLYTAIPVDARFCATGMDSIHVTVFRPPVLLLVRDTTVCQRTPVRLGAYATGDAPPFSYYWTPSTGLDHPDSARPIATPLTTTTYYVIVTDTNGCQVTDSVTVHINPLPVAHAGGNKSICNGSAVQVGLPATGGTSPFTYQWTPATGLSSTSIASPTATPTVTTKYFVTVQDKNGCTSIDSAVVTVNPLPQLAKLPDIQLCPGTSATIGESATGGTSPYTYRWSPTTGLDDWTKATPTVTPTGSGMYTLTVTDANGCTSMMNQYVAVFDEPHPLINADRTSVYCSTDSALLQFNIGVSTSKWSTGATARAIHVGAGKYWAEITDLNGCKGYSDTITITQVAPPAAVVSGPTSACPSSSASYESKDQNIATYAWTLSGGGTITSGQSTPKITVNWTTTGTWQLTLKETMQEGGCERDTTLTVTVDKDLHPTIAQRGPSTICAGDTVKLDATSGYDTYKWSTGETTEAIYVTKTGDYSVTVSNSAGCTGTSSVVHIDVLPDSVPHPSIIASALTMCSGDSIELRTAKPYALYRWSNGATASSISVSKAGRYAVTAFNTAGCAGTSDSVTVTVIQKPTVTLSALGATSFCEGDSVTLSATKGYSYEWKRDGVAITNTSDLLTVKQGGSYTVTATNTTGCSALSNAIDVTVKPRPVVSIDGPSSLCLGGESGYRVKGASGGTILWQLNPPALGTLTGQGTDTITIDWENQQDVGTLTVSVVSDACEGTATLPITIDSKLTPQITANGPLAFCDGGSVTLDAGAGYATYEWRLNGSPIVGRTSHDLTVSQSGTFTVFVTSTGGCSGESAPITVTVYPTPAKPVISASGAVLTATSAAQYSWLRNGQLLPNDTTETITADSTGDYVVVIRDAHGCEAVSDPYHYGLTFAVHVHLPRSLLVAPGDPISMPVTLSGGETLGQSGATSYQGVIRLPAHLATPVNPAGTRVGNDWLIPIGGSWSIGQTLLTTLTLKAGTVDPDCSEATIDTFYFPHSSISVATDIASICVSGECHPAIGITDTAFAINSITPNPSEGSFSMRYHIAVAGPVEISVQDVIGRTAKYFVREDKPVGSYESVFSTTDIAAGVYRIVLRSAGRTRTAHVEFIK